MHNQGRCSEGATAIETLSVNFRESKNEHKKEVP